MENLSRPVSTVRSEEFVRFWRAKISDFKLRGKCKDGFDTKCEEIETDEIKKKFSFKCKYSAECTEVRKSYGSDEKALMEVEEYLLNLHIDKDPTGVSFAKPTICKNINFQPDYENTWTNLSKKPKHLSGRSKRLNSIKVISVAQKGSGKRKAFQPKRRTDSKESHIFRFLDVMFFYNCCLNPNVNFQAKPMLDHDYLCQTLSPAERDEKQKCQLINTDFDLNSYLNTSSYLEPPAIPLPGFPFVYQSSGLEAVQIVEINSDNDPVGCVQSPVLQSSSKICSKNSTEQRIKRKKVLKMLAKPRTESVLGRVENHIPCISVASQQKTCMSDDIIDNTENIENNVRGIVLKNNRLRNKQKKRNDSPNHLQSKGVEGHLCMKSFSCQA